MIQSVKLSVRDERTDENSPALECWELEQDGSQSVKRTVEVVGQGRCMNEPSVARSTG
jgi:hypothetical protein